MHEYSIMVDIVDAALKALKGYEVESVDSLILDVGELTFLNPMQMEFSFKALTQDNILNGAELDIREMKAEIECRLCGYKGRIGGDVDGPHLGFLRLFCPQCSGQVDILRGRECIIRNIKMNLRDENNGGSDS